MNVHEAKTRMSELLARVEAGDEVIIARAGHPVATLVAIAEPTARELGFVEGFTLPDSFFEPLPDDEVSVWEGA
ncbi:prevent-host-death family protein [Microcella alkaliphila]|uniref:Antitoxin n=1 Tax=Microcella alkaliphila TaxID=279828 RepID=A0A0U5BQP4_9MICO|nr:prevent-host-death family protein [Microcella alkaliphila]BAU32598.1 antitoxin of TAS system [Microcella alkaliphila]